MATRGQFNSKSPTIKRILREAAELSNTPSPDYTATPLDDNLFEWHFTLRGPPGESPTTPSAGAGAGSSTSGGAYSEGMYHGRIVLPPTYPLRPPSFRFLTPSGRFETNREICLSISGHHEETWQPAWGLRTALVALRTFMETDAKGQLGGLECTDDMRRRIARESGAWKCSSCGKSNMEILQESADASKLADTKPDEEVPKELKMGWKDEMEKEVKEGESTPPDKDDGESGELAEGFVQTAPSVEREESAVTSAAYPAARPVQGVPLPTGAVPLAQQPQVPVMAQVQRHSNDGVPDWVDKAIVGIVICLIIMILRMLIRF